MAFSKTPVQSTYSTESIGLLKTQHSRGTTPATDADYLNTYIELVQNKEIGDKAAWISQRPGCARYINGVGGQESRGIYYNGDFKYLYYVVGSTLVVWDVANNVVAANIPGFFTTTTGEVGFTDYLFDSGAIVVVLTDGITLKMIDGTNTVTPCTDPDLPSPHQPYPIFLDGYLFLLKSGTGDLYNSNLNDPLQWTAGDFISCEIQPDTAKRPVKLNNYIAVFGTNSIEYFWDAGNTSGSPLQRNDTPVKFNGYLGGYAQWGNRILFVGNNVEGQPDVYMLEDLKMDPIGDVTVTRYLSSLDVNYSTYRGSIVGCAGHVFYVLYAGPYTYVYDLTNKQWVRWAFQSNTYFDMGGAVNTKTGTSYESFFIRPSNSSIYRFDSALGTDDGVNITCWGVTDNEEFATYNQKTLNRLVIWADRPAVSSQLQISWSDDDYQTFTTPRSVELNQERPSLDRLGRFRRRSFKWTYTGGQPFRIKGLEAFINKGSS